MTIDRIELITKHFQYIVTDYGFHISKRQFNASEMMGNAYVIYDSPKIEIEVVIDRDKVFITMGDRKDVSSGLFDLTDILRYFSPNLKKVYAFPPKTHNNSWDEVIESQIKRLASILRKYCEPMIKGDLSMKNKIKKIEEKRLAELVERYSKPLKKSI